MPPPPPYTDTIAVFTAGALLGSCLGGSITLLMGLMLIWWHARGSAPFFGRHRFTAFVARSTQRFPRRLHIHRDNLTLPGYDPSQPSSPSEEQHP